MVLARARVTNPKWGCFYFCVIFKAKVRYILANNQLCLRHCYIKMNGTRNGKGSKKPVRVFMPQAPQAIQCSIGGTNGSRGTEQQCRAVPEDNIAVFRPKDGPENGGDPIDVGGRKGWGQRDHRCPKPYLFLTTPGEGRPKTQSLFFGPKFFPKTKINLFFGLCYKSGVF